MADLKISELPVADPISDDDLFPVVQSDGASPPNSTTKKTTGLDILTFASGGGVNPAEQGFRFSLHPTDPYAILHPVTPSATDHATTDTVTLPSGHNYVTGVRCTVSATVGGLTAGMLYYLNVATNTASFHTTLANAIAGTSKVNLSADITSRILPSGIEALSGFLHPCKSDRAAVWNGSAWVIRSSSDAIIPVAFPSLTAGDQYDIYLKDNAGALDYEFSTIWGGSNARGDTLIRKNGIWVKSGAETRRPVATIRAHATNAVIDDAGGIITQVGGRRYAGNHDNAIRRDGFGFDATASWTYNSQTPHQAGGVAGNKVEFVIPFGGGQLDGCVMCQIGNTSGNNPTYGIGFNSTSAYGRYGMGYPRSFGVTVGSGTAFNTPAVPDRGIAKDGLNSVVWLESCNEGSVTSTFYGFNWLSAAAEI